MATHSSVFAWRIPGPGEPGGLPSMGLHRVRHNWSDLAAAAATAAQYICVYVCIHTCAHTHVYVYTHTYIYDICIISNIYCWWIVWSVTFRRLHKRSSFSSSNICSSWRPSLEINRRSNFKFPMLELRILNNDLEIWIPTFPREEVAKWHSLLLSANPISWKFNLQWILGATYGKNTD